MESAPPPLEISSNTQATRETLNSTFIDDFKYHATWEILNNIFTDDFIYHKQSDNSNIISRMIIAGGHFSW